MYRVQVFTLFRPSPALRRSVQSYSSTGCASVSWCSTSAVFQFQFHYSHVRDSSTTVKMATARAAAKRSVGPSRSISPPAKRGHWSLGLLDTMKDPSSQVYTDDRVVVIKDKYPKARFHFLVLPREQIAKLKALKPCDLDLLRHMHKVGDKVIKEAIGQEGLTYRLGYHAVPSMSHLHLHAISQDFDSPSLKTKKHWNAFTTAYFVESEEIIDQLEKEGKVDTSSKNPDALLKLPLRCHVCKLELGNIPKLKAHIIKHIKKS